MLYDPQRYLLSSFSLVFYFFFTFLDRLGFLTLLLFEQVENSDYNYVEQTMHKNLDGIEIKYWEENNNDDSKN